MTPKTTKTLIAALAFLATPSVGLGQSERVEAAEASTTRSSDMNMRVESATQRGLAYLAATQSRVGYWTGDVGTKMRGSYRVTAADSSHIGITALALMAFLACGELPGKGKYGDNVDRAAKYLASAAHENGYMTTNGTRMYSHAFASLALAEIYGMTKSKDVRESLQRSIQFISDSQNHSGGWRYKPFTEDSDMSITVCQVMALRSARNAGIFVARNVIADAVKYVRESERDPNENAGWGRYRRRSSSLFNNGVFKYQQRRGSRASFAVTAAGITTLYGAGIYEDPLIDRGIAFLLENHSAYNDHYENHYSLYYGNYYAVQALFMAGGERWKDYYYGTDESTGIADFFTARQSREGSWSCDLGPGTNFATAVATLILAIPFQYLPIFQR